MNKETSIKLFEQKQIRSTWDEEKEKWYFSIVDVAGVLSESIDPQAYWRKLKQRLKEEGNETVTNCHGLKMVAADGKMRKTDVADTEQLFRLIQSIPSPKAEPFKLWIAKVARERIDEIEDPEIGIDRLMETYFHKGYSKEWINQRLKSIEIRKELTDEWENRGVQKGQEFAILTDEITHSWSGFSTKQYKKFKDLKKENLRDHMTNLELVLNILPKPQLPKYQRRKNQKHFPKTEISPNKAAQLQAIPVRRLRRKQGRKLLQISMLNNWN
ncbi:MAG: Bro-N domain-containing protein [Prolixibacteraceae bacterium]